MSTVEPHAALREAAATVLADHDLVLEEIAVRPRQGSTEVRLVVDLPEDRLGSADLDTVAAASTALSELVDADDTLLGSGPSVLEITTPGVDRELTAPRHFRRARGRLLSLETHGGAEHRARLLALGPHEVLVLRAEPGTDDRGRPRKLPPGAPARIEVPLAEVASARVLIEFDPPDDLEQLIAEADPTAPKES